MADVRTCVNDVCLIGKRASGFSFSHRARGMEYYMTEFASERLSGTMDWIPVRVSKKQREMLSQNPDGYVCIKGHFQSFNNSEQGRRRLLLSVFARTMDFSDGTDTVAVNNIYLEGYVCRKTVYRKTIGGIQIADILLAVNRPYKGSDYLPCISWGKYARLAAGFSVGKRIWLKGRLQSRDYAKDVGGVREVRRAYEVSASKVGPMEP